LFEDGVWGRALVEGEAPARSGAVFERVINDYYLVTTMMMMMMMMMISCAVVAPSGRIV
jgi:hypothetical protein